MDLSSIRPAAIEVAITHPGTGEDTGLVLKLISPKDPAAAPARRTFQDRLQRKGKADEADTINFTAALVTGWDWGGESDWKGEKLPFTLTNVKAVVAESWVRAQIDERIGDNAAFFQE